MTHRPAENLQARDARDDADLRGFGYVPQLDRTMGGFSSFAVSFSLISITTGIFANFGHGLKNAGPAMIWTWILAVVGQSLVALVIADLSTRYPISGYGYQWACRLINPHVGYLVGWMLLLQYMIGFPAIVDTLSRYLVDYFMPAQTRDDWTLAVISGVTVALISAMAAIHLFGIRLVAIVNDAGVVTEIVGTAILTLILLVFFSWRRPEGLAFLLDRTNQAGEAASWAGFALALQVGAWCLTGFEGAADLAEETHKPREVVPRAVMLSIVSSGVGGLFMLASFILSIGDLSLAQQSDRPLLDLFESRLGSIVTPLVMVVVWVSIFACGMASMAAASRIIFALARDNMLPGSGFLKRVHPRHQTPGNAIILVWVLSSLVVIVLRKVELISSVATVTGYLGYGGMVLTALACKDDAVGSKYNLGRWRWPVSLTAATWTLLVVLALTLGDSQSDYSTARYSLITVAAGVALYAFFVRPRLNRGEAGPPTMPLGPIVSKELPS